MTSPVAQVIFDNLDGTAIEPEWLCDPASAIAPLIAGYNSINEQLGGRVPTRFLNPNPLPMTLAALLQRDFEWLCLQHPVLGARRGDYMFFEVQGGAPQGQHLHLHDGTKAYYVIAFSSVLMRFMRAVISKITMLTLPDRFAERPDLRDDLLIQSRYSNQALAFGMLQDLQSVYINYEPCRMTPEHLVSPYDYCDYANAARRFLLAHEIGHSLTEIFTPPASGKISGVEPNDDSDPNRDEELQCDRIAVNLMLNPFCEALRHGTFDEDMEEEFFNVVLGVLMTLLLLDMLEVSVTVLRYPGKSHPPGLERLASVMNFVYRDTTISRSLPHVRRHLIAVFRLAFRLRQFSPFTQFQADDLRIAGEFCKVAYEGICRTAPSSREIELWLGRLQADHA